MTLYLTNDFFSWTGQLSLNFFITLQQQPERIAAIYHGFLTKLFHELIFIA